MNRARSAALISILAAIVIANPRFAAAAEKHSSLLAFATLRWQGKYWSKDKPGGVDLAPNNGGSIYTICSDGTHETKIVDLGGISTCPQFSPDGKWIYFQSNAAGQYEVYRCRPDGSEVANLSALHQLGDEWRTAGGCVPSSDGKKIVYSATAGFSQVVVADADGTNAAFVAPKLGYTYMARLNSNGSRVVFSGPAGGYRLFAVDLPNGEPRSITPNHPESFAPQFTPDDKTIVFTRRDGDIYRVDPDGRNLQRLTNGNQYVEFRLSDEDHHGSTDAPAISPDGQRIAYVAVKDGVPQVCTMNIDGSDQRQITHRSTPCARVQWGRNGKQVAFVSFEGAYPQLFVVEADGSDVRCLTNFRDGGVFHIHWHP